MGAEANMIRLDRSWFIQSRTGNIKDQYFFEKKLGSGGYGAVYLAMNKQTGAKVAVKAMQKGKIQDYESFKNEINILTEAQAALIMRQAFYALNYLHTNRICHRDIKPENFLLYKEDDDSHVKLIDFGLAKRVGNNEVMNAPNGTPYYIAPEVLKGSYTTQCDNWSMGIVLFIMLSGKPPFGGKSNKEIIDNVLRGSYSFSTPVWENISDQAKDFISKLLTRQADERLTAEEAYNHPWLAE